MKAHGGFVLIGCGIFYIYIYLVCFAFKMVGNALIVLRGQKQLSFMLRRGSKKAQPPRTLETRPEWNVWWM